MYTLQVHTGVIIIIKLWLIGTLLSYNKPLDFLKFIMVKIYTDFANAVHVILLKIFNCQQQV